jgi:hypothetical protein
MKRYTLGVLSLLFFHGFKEKGLAGEVGEKIELSSLETKSINITQNPSNFPGQQEIEKWENQFIYTPETELKINKNRTCLEDSALEKKWGKFFLSQTENICKKEDSTPQDLSQQKWNQLFLIWADSAPINLYDLWRRSCRKHDKNNNIPLTARFCLQVFSPFVFNEAEIEQIKFSATTVREQLLIIKGIEENNLQFSSLLQELSNPDSEILYLDKTKPPQILRIEILQKLFYILSNEEKCCIKKWRKIKKELEWYYLQLIIFSTKTFYYLEKIKLFRKQYKSCLSDILLTVDRSLSRDKGLKISTALNEVKKRIKWLGFFPKILEGWIQIKSDPTTDYTQYFNEFFGQQPFFKDFSAIVTFFLERIDQPNIPISSVSLQYFSDHLLLVKDRVQREIASSLSDVYEELQTFFPQEPKKSQKAFRK